METAFRCRISTRSNLCLRDCWGRSAWSLNDDPSPLFLQPIIYWLSNLLRLNIGHAFLTWLGKMLFVPRNRTIRRIDLMFHFGKPVSLARIPKENGLNAYVLQRNKQLFCFGNGNIVIVLPMNDEG